MKREHGCVVARTSSFLQKRRSWYWRQRFPHCFREEDLMGYCSQVPSWAGMEREWPEWIWMSVWGWCRTGNWIILGVQDSQNDSAISSDEQRRLEQISLLTKLHKQQSQEWVLGAATSPRSQE